LRDQDQGGCFDLPPLVIILKGERAKLWAQRKMGDPGAFGKNHDSKAPPLQHAGERASGGKRPNATNLKSGWLSSMSATQGDQKTGLQAATPKLTDLEITERSKERVAHCHSLGTEAVVTTPGRDTMSSRPDASASQVRGGDE
jgi:hypothetical protein